MRSLAWNPPGVARKTLNFERAAPIYTFVQLSTLWRWWVAAGVLATVGYYLLPTGGLASNLFYASVGLVSAATILVGVRLHRPRNRTMWYWFAAGQAVSACGDLVWAFYVFVLEQEPYPSLADVFYLLFYPVLAAGLWLLVRSRRAGARITEAAMAGVSLGLVFWIFVLHPIAADSSASALERIIGTAYPAGDALLLAILARLMTARTGTTSTRLLTVATVLLLVSDVGFSVVSLYSGGDGDEFSAGFLLAYVLWAAAALHPAMASEAEKNPARTARTGRGQPLVLTACALLAPAMLFIPGVGDNAVDRIAIGASSAVLIVLVATRVTWLVRKVQGQADQLELVAMRDELTGLPNRRHFEHALAEATVTGPRHIAFLGLSGFKNINDELGRPVGDQVLVVVAARLLEAAPGNTLVARVGGDEFALLLPGPDVAALLTALAAPVDAAGHQLLVGASLGVAEAGEPVELLRRAESAMHAAKETGEPYRCWSQALDERAGEHARLGAEMAAAIHGGQFAVVYQPIVAVPEGRVAAVEALVRWHHPQRGMISPAHFIPVAEQNGLIVELGAWILRTACEQMARWRSELGTRAPDRVSVNVSARQLARPEFPRTVAAALATAGLPPQCLTVEVTETAVFAGGQAVTALHELRALGVRIALDDFGTGHSSLGLLQTVPVDVLKVDKSFVDNITEAGRHVVIARALIQVCEGLGLTAVAEGVETAEQAQALYDLGYRLLQGYHYGRPVADPFPALTSPAPH
ncbi:putative bifunctional diguanylate cyclase/phosphodiesterase [Actinoplanes sp. GCM10030250]|uniref:putative bifunctional diguanylate cyclase/phosphodiesterase n=1 Tax=Actinoplanes sp. GCM10030250 TaxID=3273376 RepID=UPI0036163D9F